ncbi:hypothetical protein, partial [Staphylococcus pseudintermedius]|uniref:hypothetical protein n=1 Tax=Staphylococcus pseudintermedius TaxID=283734 RepID=UPI001A8F6B89
MNYKDSYYFCKDFNFNFRLLNKTFTTLSMATYNTIVALLENPFKIIAQKNFFYRFSGYNHSNFFLVCA